MKVGIIKETKVEEYRVGLTPAAVRALVGAGHQVLVERGAGLGSGYGDEDYIASGATVLSSAADVATACELLVKVKEPLPHEYDLLRPGLILFTFLHLAANRELTERLLATGMTAIAYETVRGPDGSLPLLAPMSQIAGRMAAEVGAQLLKKPGPGRGKLLGGIPGVEPAWSRHGRWSWERHGGHRRLRCLGGLGGARIAVLSRRSGGPTRGCALLSDIVGAAILNGE